MKEAILWSVIIISVIWLLVFGKALYIQESAVYQSQAHQEFMEEIRNENTNEYHCLVSKERGASEEYLLSNNCK